MSKDHPGKHKAANLDHQDSQGGGHETAREKAPDKRAVADAGDAAARRMATAKGAEEPANTAPWEKEVDGIPANAQHRVDDDEQIVSMETSEKKNEVSVAGGKGSFAHGKTTTVKEGDATDVHEAKTEVSVGSEKGLEVGRSHSDEHTVGDDVSMKDKHSKGADVGAHGGHVKMGHETEVRVGEDKHTSGRDTSVGIKDGHLDAERTATTKVEDEHGAHSTSHSAAIADGKLQRGWSEEHETKRKVKETGADGTEQEVEKTSKRGKETKVAVGREGVSGERRWTKTKEDGGSSGTSVGAELGKDGNASVNAAHTVTDKNGNSFTVSAKAGIEVYASEPVQKGDRFIVSYKRTKSVGAGAGASSHGMGAGGALSKSSFEDGTRSFKTKDEANEFREHAAERIRDAGDPTSVAGAMSLEIGESRGSGDAVEGSLGASASFEGASLGASAHAQKSEEVDVRRVSATVFEATFMKASEKGGDLEAGGMGVSTGAGSSSNKHSALTVRFDLSTSDGKAAFEKFTKDHQPPAKGGQVVSTDDGKGHESHDGTKIAGYGSASYGSRTSEDTLVDEQGKHETYEGEQSHDISTGRIGHWLGDKDQHSSVSIVSRQENDKDAGYAVEGKFSGESGTSNRAKMRHLMGIEENFDEDKVDKGHSGEWTMSAEISKKAISNLEKYDDRYKGLKTNDDKMRALSEQVADKGASAINDIEGMGNKPLAWDVELKGDKNFPGHEGRMETEAKLQRYGALLAESPTAAPIVATQVQGELDALKERRHAVDDRKKYLDLPDALREQQLAMIDKEIRSFEGIRHQATIEATKNHAGEKIDDIQKRHHVDKNGYGQMTPEEGKVAELRDNISENDHAILDIEKRIDVAKAAILDASSHHTDYSKTNSTLIHRRETGYKAGVAIAESHTAQYKGLDAMRASLLANSSKPEAALQIAKQLDSQVKIQLDMAMTAYQQFEEAAIAQINMNKSGSMGSYDEFWADILANSMDASDLTQEDIVTASDEKERDDDPPAKRVSMSLPQHHR